MKTRIKNILSNAVEYFSIVFFMLSILPFIILAVFVQPSWDDFGYAYYSNAFGFLKAQYIWYFSFSGRYFSTAVLSSLNPMVYGTILGYKIITLLLLVLFIILIYFFISELFSGSISKREKILCALAFNYLFLYGLPSVSLAFYWLSSNVIYQLANILMLILFILLLKFFNSEIKKSTVTVIMAAIIIFFIEGSNEISMLTLTLFLTLVFLINLIICRKINKWLLIFMCASIFSFCAVYFAPGNNVRLMDYPQSHRLFFSFSNSIKDLFRFTIYRIYNLPLLLFTLIFIPFSSKIISGKNFKNRFLLINPLYSIFIFICILTSGFLVSYWSLGTTVPYRALNVIYFLFLTGWFVNIFIAVNYLKIKFNFEFNILPRYAYLVISLMIFFSFAKETNNIKAAYKDLLSGSAQKFDSELKERYNFIKNNSADTCEIDSIKIIPKSFFFCDITPDSKSLFNRYYAFYFNKKFMISNKVNLDSLPK